MKINEIDKNLSFVSNIPKNEIVWYDPKEEPFTVYGVADVHRYGYCRVPPEIAKKISVPLYLLAQDSAGGRIRFKTDSPYVVVRVKMSEVSIMSHSALINSAGFDLYENNNSGCKYLSTAMPPMGDWIVNAEYIKTDDIDRTVRKPYEYLMWAGEKMQDLTLNLPSYGAPMEIFIGLKKGSNLHKTDGYRDCAPILYYGSSITQGGCATRPGLIYQNFIARRFNIDYINLGFSGNGFAQDEMIDYMNSLDFSVFVSDYDHNAPTEEHLRNTHYKLYERIREKHPDVPYIMISKPDYDTDPLHSSPRRDIIYQSYLKAKEHDGNVYFVDGKRLFGGENRGNCTVDGCHPNDLGMYRFSDALIGELQQIL